jgi:quinol monooxygenase YgiN
MFIRFVTFKSAPGKVAELREFFNNDVYAVLQQTPGCLFAALVESTVDRDEFSALTLWETADAIQAYEDSGSPAAFTEMARSLFLAESDEWRLQLSEDLALEYKPVIEEPEASAYRVFAVMDEAALVQNRAANMHLRLVRVRATEAGLEGFKRHYVETAIPALRQVQGCRNAFLIGNLEAQSQLISVTIWDSAQDAEAYDRSPLFQSMLTNTRDLMSAHVWQTTLQTTLPSKVYTSDNVKVETYAGVTGQTFQAG